MIHQCLRDATLKDIEAAGLMGYYTMHSKGVYPADPNGVPFTAAYLQCTGDPIADITEDMAADAAMSKSCLLYTSPSPRDFVLSRMPSSA